jgi:hypothetical protein
LFANLIRVMNRFSRQSAFLAIVVATLMMRAAIPVGYMPASEGSGLLFELCPTAVPAEILAAMSGSDHAHHHGGDAGDSHFDAEQCPIGQLLSLAVAVDIASPVDSAPESAPPAIDVIASPGSRTPVNRRSRSPPA